MKICQNLGQRRTANLSPSSSLLRLSSSVRDGHWHWPVRVVLHGYERRMTCCRQTPCVRAFDFLSRAHMYVLRWPASVRRRQRLRLHAMQRRTTTIDTGPSACTERQRVWDVWKQRHWHSLDVELSSRTRTRFSQWKNLRLGVWDAWPTLARLLACCDYHSNGQMCMSPYASSCVPAERRRVKATAPARSHVGLNRNGYT